MSQVTRHDINELHWSLGLLQNLEVGLIVVDRSHRIRLWNGFMENHAGLPASQAIGQQLFSRFPELPEQWLTTKLRSVFQLRNPAYISWEQRPYLFPFKSKRPITGSTPHMIQNITLLPLTSPTGEVDHAGILIYDVTDTAVNQAALLSANQQLQSLSRTDGLTGLYNRAYWQECLEHEFARFQRSQETSSLVMFDIDFFKKINDGYGHQAGDEVIRSISRMLKQHSRKTDITGRYGGEEFSAILTSTGADNALIFAERLRQAVENSLVEYNAQQLSCTISLGIAEIDPLLMSPEDWLERADQALYQSKQNGRNRVTLYLTE